MSAGLTVLASNGSLSVSLLFGGPVIVMLLVLLAMTVRDRRRERRER